MLVVIDDLTELRTAAKFRADADRWMWHTFEDSVVPTSVLTPKGEFARVNRAFSRFSGYSRAELIDHDGSLTVFPEDRKDVRKRFDETLAADSAHYEQRFRHRTGDELWGFVAASAVKDDAGEVLYVLCQIVDITERKRFEHRLSEREGILTAQQAKLRELASKLIREREDAIRAVAREAHDTFAQDAVGAAMKLAELEEKLADAPAATRRALHARVKEIRALAEGIHGFARRIHPSHLDELGLTAAVRMEADKIAKEYGLAVKIAEKGKHRDIPGDIALTAFRVAQEALQNVVKHATAKNVNIVITQTPAEVAISIRDNGKGFVVRSPRKTGLGLLAMEERVREAGGSLEVRSIPKRYTELEVHLPLKRNRNLPRS